jgi:hypothetical protein
MQRSRLVVAALAVLALTAPAFGQGAKAAGNVKDTNGRPIKGATITATNRDAVPPEIASTSDDKGRWAMIGLRTGAWTFVVEAPGFVAVKADAPIRVAGTAPMSFTLARDPGPIPGALDRNVLQLVQTANGLRDKGQYDQALTAYQHLREENPKLTSLGLAVAGVYRQQAAAETNPAARRVLLDRAVDTYNQLLEDDTIGWRAQAEIESTRTELQALPR